MSVDVYLGANFVSVSCVESQLGDLDLPASLVVETAFKQVTSMSRSWLRPRTRVWLSSAWVRPYVVQPVSGLKNWGEAKLVAQAQAPGWSNRQLEVALDQWPGGVTPTLALAAEADLLSNLREQAKVEGLRIDSIKPWWSAPGCIPRSSAGRQLLCAVDPDGLTLVLGDDTAYLWATSYAPGPQPDQTDALLHRTLMGQNLPMAALRHLRWSAGWLTARHHEGSAPDKALRAAGGV